MPTDSFGAQLWTRTGDPARLQLLRYSKSLLEAAWGPDCSFLLKNVAKYGTFQANFLFILLHLWRELLALCMEEQNKVQGASLPVEQSSTMSVTFTDGASAPVLGPLLPKFFSLVHLCQSRCSLLLFPSTLMSFWACLGCKCTALPRYSCMAQGPSSCNCPCQVVSLLHASRAHQLASSPARQG